LPPDAVCAINEQIGNLQSNYHERFPPPRLPRNPPPPPPARFSVRGRASLTVRGRPFAIQSRDYSLCFGVLSHFDKCETSGSPGKFVFNDRYRSDLSVGFKKLPNVTLAGIEGQITYINVHTKHLSLKL
jgi:hypothetical protein